MPTSGERILRARTGLPGRKNPHDPNRRGHHLSREALASRIGVASTTLQKWEGSGLPYGAEYAALARALGCSLDYLLGLSEEPAPALAATAPAEAEDWSEAVTPEPGPEPQPRQKPARRKAG